MDNIIQAGQVDIQNKIQQCIDQSDIEWRRGGMILYTCGSDEKFSCMGMGFSSATVLSDC